MYESMMLATLHHFPSFQIASQPAPASSTLDVPDSLVHWMAMNYTKMSYFQTLPFLSILTLNLSSTFVFFLCVIGLPQCQALEFRSISGPPETSGSIDPGGVVIVGCTLQYPGKLDSSSSLHLVGTDGNRTQVSFSSLNSTTSSQSYSTVPIPKDVQSGYYFLVAVDTNRTVIASSYNFQISDNVRDSDNTMTSDLPGSPTNLTTPEKLKNSNVGAIAGGVVGGVVGLVLLAFAIFFFIRWRRRKKDYSENSATDMTQYFEEPTPFLSTAPSEAEVNWQDDGALTIVGASKMRQQKKEMLGQRERLERQLEDYLQGVGSPSEIGTGNGGLDSVPSRAVGAGSDDAPAVPELQEQVNVMTQRIAILEAELAEQAPPEYASQYNP
ncbi:hypothetical protein E1B28_003013 [Marasmius oreades]|uniref:Uncharacterized protein n=1 Tax=Marasmius oreades TaxID=181124 RepID=A0A9P7RKS8_9AGAR|nr:uncharacterized protein E1B28_003013 [Marasmius oreades]KAG7085452.1 hypothetical protein E1B28_003013 [Marasmius oreades]